MAIIFGSAHSSEGRDRKDLLFEHSSPDDEAGFVAATDGADKCSALVKGIIGDGFFTTTRTSSAGACCAACLANAGCVAYTWEGHSESASDADAECFLKDNLKKGGVTADRVSGSGLLLPAMPCVVALSALPSAVPVHAPC